MDYKICIFIEQNFIPLRYKKNLEVFIYSLKEFCNVYLYSPDIDYFYQKNSNNISILKLNNIMTFRNNIYYNGIFDALILFSDYDKNLHFDRRNLIVNSFKYSKLIIIPTYNILSYIPIEFNKKNCEALYLTDKFSNNIISDITFKVRSLFDLNIKYDKKQIDNFYSKYDIDKDKKIIAFIPASLKLWYELNVIEYEYKEYNIYSSNIFLRNIEYIKKKLLDNDYYLIGIRNYEDNKHNYSNINIKWVDNIDYNLTKYICHAIVTIANIDYFRYLNLNKPIIEIGEIPIKYLISKNNIKNSKMYLFFDKIFKQNNNLFVNIDNIKNLSDIINSEINKNKNNNDKNNFNDFKLDVVNYIKLLFKDYKNINIPISNN